GLEPPRGIVIPSSLPWLHWLFLAILAIAAREAARHRREPFGCGIVAKEFLLILERACRPMSHCPSLGGVRLHESAARAIFSPALSLHKFHLVCCSILFFISCRGVFGRS